MLEDDAIENTYTITLNDDGTRTGISDEGTGTYTLLSATTDSLKVLGADDD